MQLHYRSTNYKGELDVESVAILFSLIEKYRVLEIDDLIN
jgi:N-acetyl-anhydromuramyl-L-alanine amidase AmpD